MLADHAGVGLEKPGPTWGSIWESDMKSNKKRFYKHMNSKTETRENFDAVLSAAGDLVTDDAGKAEVLSAFFTQPGKASLQES